MRIFSTLMTPPALAARHRRSRSVHCLRAAASVRVVQARQNAVAGLDQFDGGGSRRCKARKWSLSSIAGPSWHSPRTVGNLGGGEVLHEQRNRQVSVVAEEAPRLRVRVVTAAAGGDVPLPRRNQPSVEGDGALNFTKGGQSAGCALSCSVTSTTPIPFLRSGWHARGRFSMRQPGRRAVVVRLAGFRGRGLLLGGGAALPGGPRQRREYRCRSW